MEDLTMAVAALFLLLFLEFLFLFFILLRLCRDVLFDGLFDYSREFPGGHLALLIVR